MIIPCYTQKQHFDYIWRMLSQSSTFHAIVHFSCTCILRCITWTLLCSYMLLWYLISIEGAAGLVWFTREGWTSEAVWCVEFILWLSRGWLNPVWVLISTTSVMLQIVMNDKWKFLLLSSLVILHGQHYWISWVDLMW